MKIFLTGATGFIGSHLLKRLRKEDEKHQIKALVRNESKIQDLQNQSVEVIKGDITQPETFAEQILDSQWVFHLAAALGAERLPDEVYWRVNVDGAGNILEVSQKMPDLKKVVFVSSVAVTGPIKNPPADETAPYNPNSQSSYAVTKTEGEKITVEYIKKGLPINIIRPTIVYGENDRHSNMLNFFKAVKNHYFLPIGRPDKSPLYHPCYVENLVEALILAAKTGVSGEIFIIGDQECPTLLELAKIIAKHEGVTIPPIYLPLWLAKIGGLAGDLAMKFGLKLPLNSERVGFMTENWGYSLAKAEKMLGYKPPFSLKEGVGRTVKWYEENKLL